jgi:hypothetical protein
MKENLFEYVLEQLRSKNVEECYNYLNNNPSLSSKLWDDTLEYLFNSIKPRDINTINDLANLLNCNSNGNELENPYNINVEEICRKNKWIILFPYSDDCLEVRGYIDDELGAWGNTNYKIIKKGDFYPDKYENNTYHKTEKNMICITEEDSNIRMLWDSDEHPYTWWIEVNCNDSNVAYFDIIDEDDEEGETWARCCVIDCSNIL